MLCERSKRRYVATIFMAVATVTATAAPAVAEVLFSLISAVALGSSLARFFPSLAPKVLSLNLVCSILRSSNAKNFPVTSIGKSISFAVLRFFRHAHVYVVSI